MRVVSIGDLVTDYHYKDGKLLGINGGMTSHNIIANLSGKNIDTTVFGVCGNDDAGKIAIQSLSDLKVDISNIRILNDIKTRVFHISYCKKNDEVEYISGKRCPYCNNKNWYDESMIDTEEILKQIKEDDILVFDNLNSKNQIIIDNTKNKKMLDLGQFLEFESYSTDEIVNKINNKFEIINLNERVEKYLLTRLELDNILDIYNRFNPKLLIVTKGNKGANLVFDKNVFIKELKDYVQEIDTTGAGDSFFATFIREYIKNDFIINNKFIDSTFNKAIKVTSKVVSKIGSRSHLRSLYKVKKVEDKCICQNFSLIVRKPIKRCNININNLNKRVIKALESDAYNKLKTIDFSTQRNTIFVGTGGSYAAANFASRVINQLYGINTSCFYPRDILYRNTINIDKAYLFSYSGTTNDLLEGCKNINDKNKYIITKGEVQKVASKTGISKNNIISYHSSANKSKERGFLSFEGTIAPSSLFLKLFLEVNYSEIQVVDFINSSIFYWNNYFNELFKNNKYKLKEIMIKGNTFNLFTGDYVTSACFDLESKIIESGIFNVLIHEKKNFSHGRFINYEHLSKKINIYFRQKDISTYERGLLNYLDNENLIVIESKYNGILCEYDLLIASQYLVYYISNFLDTDMSKPTYSEDAMKIYFYKGEL
jgi:sugar/nucleoside kinase (ribokinase family)